MPATLLDDQASGYKGTRRLDLAAEVQRYGADTEGGVGISRLYGAPAS